MQQGASTAADAHRARDTPNDPPAPAITAPAESTLRALLAIVEATLRELHADAPGLPAATPASLLDRDLGLDSLSRMELLLRIERGFGIQLPEDTLQRADSVADLLQAVQRASCAAPAAARAIAVPSAGPTREDVHEPAAVDASPGSATTLLEAFDWHLAAHGDRTHVTVLSDDAAQAIAYRELAQRSAAVAAGLQHAGIAPRQCVAIMLPTSPEYFATYLGILRAGAIPVPIYPPARASQLQDHVLRHVGILDNAQAVAMVTASESILVARLLQARLPGLRHVVTPQQLLAGQAAPQAVAVQAHDIAFIQYTSGSTGRPKGVALTHANLLANIRAMVQAVQASPRDVFVSWLPLYHDMGLIGAWLTALVVGFPLVVMSPLAFLARPARWLQAIDRYRGTLSAGPNFAYELCLKRIVDADLAGVDLSCWRLAFNGAEAVSPDTVERFAARFAAHGLRREAVAPVYGLAEACVGLLFPPPGRGPLVDRVQREPFSRERRAVPAAADDASALRFVACGSVLPGHAVRIVDEAGRELADRAEGRLEFKGPSATRGYFRNPQQTERLIHDGWVDTGDRAYRVGGEIYVTGRVKDIVIRGGRNLYPQEIEEAVGALDGVRKGCVAVFGSPDAATGTEQLVVLAEVRALGAAARAALHDAVARAVVGAIGEPPDRIVLAPPHTVLKTSSGKVRRSACRELFESGAIGAAAPSARAQLLRLAFGALGPRLRQLARAAGTLAFGLFASALFWLVAPLAWLLIAATRRPAQAWAIGRAAARALLRAMGTPLQVEGLDRLPPGPCVLVCNHGSYADGALLVAALPQPFVFVAKRELLAQPVARIFLQRLGTVFVERADTARSVADAARLADVLKAGHSPLVFPEGTFVEQPGLLPFHLGAFLAAAQAGVPVVPAAIRGNRELLPDDSWWPRRSRIAVSLGEPIAPPTDAPDVFAAAVRLRDAARSRIARQLDVE
ncbi:MAG: AMP-binding protein [Burkholderiaceae bacterium]